MDPAIALSGSPGSQQGFAGCLCRDNPETSKKRRWEPSEHARSLSRSRRRQREHFPRSVRIQIPRSLIALYEVRNNRGVGHVGGDVDPNPMDARIVLKMARWVVAELVRVSHGLDTAEAKGVVEHLIE